MINYRNRKDSEVAVAQSRYYSDICQERLSKTTRNIRITEIRTGYHTETSLESYRYSNSVSRVYNKEQRRLGPSPVVTWWVVGCNQGIRILGLKVTSLFLFSSAFVVPTQSKTPFPGANLRIASI